MRHRAICNVDEAEPGSQYPFVLFTACSLAPDMTRASDHQSTAKLINRQRKVSFSKQTQHKSEAQWSRKQNKVVNKIPRNHVLHMHKCNNADRLKFKRNDHKRMSLSQGKLSMTSSAISWNAGS